MAGRYRLAALRERAHAARESTTAQAILRVNLMDTRANISNMWLILNEGAQEKRWS
jgi:hypothetical protein